MNGLSLEPAPTVSIVIVNSDSTEDTLRCLESIFSHASCQLVEVILVDNCSRTPCLPLVQERFPQVRTFSAPTRQGFARNYNLGMRQARGEYVMILNNDTLVQAGALDALIDALRQHTEYGIVGPRLLSANGRLQTVCARPLLGPRLYTLTLLLLDLGLPTGRWYDALRRRRLMRRASGPVPCLSGAGMMLSRATLERVGLLDEGYDFYFEDVEWCHRVQQHGLKAAYIAEAAITHLGDQSLSRVKELAKRSEYLSAQRYFQQYYQLSLWQLRLVWLAAALSFLLRMLVFKLGELMTHRRGYAREYLNLFRWILSKFPMRNNDVEQTTAR